MSKWHNNNAGKLFGRHTTYNFLNNLRNEESALFYAFTFFIWALAKCGDLIYIFMYILYDLLLVLLKHKQ